MKTILCIVCPNGCRLNAEKSAEGSGYAISGNKCKRGIDFAIAEITNPTRTLTTTVRTSFSGVPAVLGSEGFEPSKAEPTDLQKPKLTTFNSIETILAPKSPKCQVFWVFLTHLTILNLFKTH